MIAEIIPIAIFNLVVSINKKYSKYVTLKIKKLLVKNIVIKILQTNIFQWSPWRTANELYHMIENAVDRDTRQLKIDLTESQRLHCVLRDLSTLTQALARLSTYFTDQGNCIKL